MFSFKSNNQVTLIMVLRSTEIKLLRSEQSSNSKLIYMVLSFYAKQKRKIVPSNEPRLFRSELKVPGHLQNFFPTFVRF